MTTNQDAQQLLIFKLGKEEYGVDIQKVQEIRNYEKTTLIADQPNYVKGVFNLRGAIVPVLDLRIKFNLKEVLYNDFTVVIILNYNKKTIGIVVDSVSDVLTLNNEQIQKSEHIERFTESGYLKSIGVLDDRMIQMVDIDKFIDEADLLQAA